MIRIVNTTHIHHLAEIGDDNNGLKTRCNRTLTYFIDNSRMPLAWEKEEEWLANGVKVKHCSRCGSLAKFIEISDRDSMNLEKERIERVKKDKEQRDQLERMREEHYDGLVPALYSLFQSWLNVPANLNVPIKVEKYARGSEISFTLPTDDGVHKFTLRGSF